MKKQTPEQMMKAALRYERGLALLNDPNYTFVPFTVCNDAFVILKSDGAAYTVLVGSWDCNCADFKKTKEGCKHLYACEELMKQNALLADAETFLMEEANAEDVKTGCCPL